MRTIILSAIALSLSACATVPPGEASSEPTDAAPTDWHVGTDPGAVLPPEPTRVLDPVMATKLRENTGITLQWIDWDRRGEVQVTEDARGVWRLSGMQRGSAGDQRFVSVQGIVTEIGKDYFLLDGEVRIENAPDAGRVCEQDKVWRFGVTQNRQYWRLREFEWCDRLTDYIDIYF